MHDILAVVVSVTGRRGCACMVTTAAHEQAPRAEDADDARTLWKARARVLRTPRESSRLKPRRKCESPD
ncbi:MAG: hypothetical protein JWM18_1055 [Chloroflexi bacterium]|jgi:hypothetical protein|nr:hypothetical protein [Chloroflexota bacterium]